MLPDKCSDILCKGMKDKYGLGIDKVKAKKNMTRLIKKLIFRHKIMIYLFARLVFLYHDKNKIF
ncbi:MAG: hypothetical protein CSB55_04665 [Candidatus Cloacimonadota bacterium]|nr:MAG: hypothetical protein CSB55_04665 [Candidatus Cloacimonadota bacterium]